MKLLASIAALSLFASTHLIAGTILYNQAGVLSGYRATNSTAFTAAFDTAFDGTPILTSDFSNATQVMSADLVFVNVANRLSGLSATEQTNLQAFAATGKPVIMLGDNYLNFQTWNASILTPFGGVPFAFTANTPGLPFKVNDHPLTLGLDVLPDTVNPGTIFSGGFPLWKSDYSPNPYTVGALFGPSDNVLILLELGPLNNTTLATNMGSWASTLGSTNNAVPSPSSISLFAAAGLLALARRRRVTLR